MALKNLETARKNQAAIKAREAKIPQAEREAQAKPNNPQASYNLARVYAFYGEKELAYEWLAKALKQRYRDIGYLRSDPALNSIREERDFQLLLKPYIPLGPKNRANAAQFPRKLFLYDRPCREAVSCWANMHAVGLKFICAFELWGK
jgi:tetratricopeptide (TPR) repeat protein